MSRSKLSLPEGTWFAVPLRNGGFARGLIARTSEKGPVFGYFFGPKASGVNSLPTFANLHPKDAVLVGKFGDLGLLSGEWEVLGHDKDWDRNKWPLPPLVRVDEIECTATLAMYADDLELLSEEQCDISLAQQYPRDSLMGYGFVEIKLTQLLD